MHVVVRVDGGPDIGYGHLVRSGSLARELLSRGHEVTYATATPGPTGDVCPPASVVSLPSRGDPEPFLDYVETATPDTVFTDAYPVDTAYQRAVHERTSLAVLQDDARHAVSADMFVNGNLYAPDLDYEFVGSSPDQYLGAEYLLVREAFRTRARRRPPWRDRPKRALVTMGGSDVTNLSPRVIRAFDAFDIEVDAIVGPGFSQDQAMDISKAAESCSGPVRIAHDPEDLPERMFKADFGVCTASSTTYELLALGTPLICFPVADNQTPIAEAIRDRNAGAVLDHDASHRAIERAIETYITDRDLRRERRERGRALVDARGTKRVANALSAVA